MSLRRNIALAAIAAGCVACDQGTKHYADLALLGRPPIEFLDGTIRLLHTYNPGAWGSLGANWPDPLRLLALVLLPVVALVAVSVQVLRRPDVGLSEAVAVALFVGGGAGNLIDRIWRGSVLDFVIIGRGWLHTNVFNVADVAIVAGALLYAVALYRRSRERRAAPTPPTI